MNICIVGMGYVGLVTGACFAHGGHQVWCVDVDEEKINNLTVGKLPIYEPGLTELITQGIAAGCLHFTQDLKKSIESTVVCFIAVGTPATQDGSADLAAVLDVAEKIGKYMKEYLLVVTKSTVPVGTVERIREGIKAELHTRGQETIAFDVAFNPEFLKEGTAVSDFLHPHRIIFGTDQEAATQLLTELYQSVVEQQYPILQMDIRSAEITKYAANAMLATRISFMNEIAQLCDKVGGDIERVRLGIGADLRIGNEFLHAGIGYGGSCFPKDIKELIHTGQQHDLVMELVTAVQRVNEWQKNYFIKMITRRFTGKLVGKKIAIWGLAFKGQTDDMREAPSIAIIQSLLALGAKVTVYDPAAMEHGKQVFGQCYPHLQYEDSMMEILTGVDALVLITDWQQFKQPNFEEMLARMGQPLIFDGRNQYDPMHMKSLGFEYYCIGRNCYA